MKTKVKTASLDYEEKLYAQGFTLIGGIDEVGRGPLAGPVVACAVILPPSFTIPGVNDSKALSPKRREELACAIKDASIDYALGWADANLIDEINILQATYEAMSHALGNLKTQPDALLIDGVQGKWLPSVDTPCTFIKGGDSASHSIAAASIIAKVARDAFMLKAHEEYPQYGFDAHKGYGTAKHMVALKAHGPCPLHRRSFIKKVLNHD